MKWNEILSIVGEEPVFSSSLLKVGDVLQARIEVQLSRWVKAGRILQLRRGLYVLVQPYRKVEPHPFLLANALTRASYVSLQSALAHYGLIPEHVPVVTSVTTGRTGRRQTALGSFVFRHVKHDMFHGFQKVQVAAGQEAYVAQPEKALLDLVYLSSGGDDPKCLHELRLQNTEILETAVLTELVERNGKPKLKRALQVILRLMETEAEYEEL